MEWQGLAGQGKARQGKDINLKQQGGKMNKCNQCGYEWNGKKTAKACARCKRYDWNEPNKKELR